MSKLIQAIEQANVPLKQAGLPSYDTVVEPLQAAENKLAAMQRYHAGGSAQSIQGFREKISDVLQVLSLFVKSKIVMAWHQLHRKRAAQNTV